MKVLVTSASRHEATAEIGAAIASALSGRGLAVDARAVDDVASLDDYDAVVLGSAVYAGSWLRAAHVFVDRHADELRQRRVWLFSSGPIQATPEHPVDPKSMHSLDVATGAIDHHVFEGRLDRRLISAGERIIANVVHVGEGDFRDWGEVRDWANRIADELGAAPGPPAPTTDGGPGDGRPAGDMASHDTADDSASPG